MQMLEMKNGISKMMTHWVLTNRLGTTGLPRSGPRRRGRSDAPHMLLVLLEFLGQLGHVLHGQMDEAQGEQWKTLAVSPGVMAALVQSGPHDSPSIPV